MSKNTVLVWSEIVGKVTWNMANRLASGYGKGFRMPSVGELVSCFNYSTGKPKAGFESFEDKLIWTSTGYAGDPTQSYHINMKNGLVNYSRNDNQHCVVYVKDEVEDNSIVDAIEITVEEDKPKRGRPRKKGAA